MGSDLATVKSGVAEKASSGSGIAAVGAGVELKTFDDMWYFAKVVVESGMVDRSRNVASVCISLQAGAELGFSPIQSIHSIPTVKGRPCMEATAQRALINNRATFAHGGQIDVGMDGDGDGRVGWCVSQRHGWKEPRRTEFSWKQAVTAGLTKDRGGATSIYKLYDEDMLIAKATARHAKRYYPDVTMGLVTTDEAWEVYGESKDTTPAIPEDASGPVPLDPLLAITAPDEGAEPPEPEASTEDPEAPEEQEQEQDSEYPMCGKEAPGELGLVCMMAPGHEEECDWDELVGDADDPGPVPDEIEGDPFES